MHSLVLYDNNSRLESIKNLLSDYSKEYNKIGYITFTEPSQIIVKIIENPLASGKFILINASKNKKQPIALNNSTYEINTEQLFDVYLFLVGLIRKENIDALFLDSVSSLILKHSNLPLKKMITDLLFEVGKFDCDSVVLADKMHSGHEVIQHLNNFFSNFRQI